MAKLTQVKTDKDFSENGVWVPWLLDIRLKIARFSNPEFKKFYSRKTKPLQRKLATIPDDVHEAIIMEGVAKHILVDWENLQNDNGESLEYSWETAVEFFKDPELVDMYDFVLTTARQADAFRKELQEDLEGN